MTVYVDDMYLSPMGRLGRMKMSHMIADTDDELHAMAREIGVARKWHQGAPAHDSHYDITMSKREIAIASGAVPITLRLCGLMSMERRRTGELPTPAGALRSLAARLSETSVAIPDGKPTLFDRRAIGE